MQNFLNGRQEDPTAPAAVAGRFGSFALVIALLAVFLSIGATIHTATAAADLPETISGVVRGTDGVLGGVTVQVQGTTIKIVTAANGRYTLTGITYPTAITAYTPGYYVGWIKLDPAAADWAGVPVPLDFTLKPLYKQDVLSYPWFSFGGIDGSASCAACHRENPEYDRDAHSQSAQNIRFLSMYLGTNAQGEGGQRTVFGLNGLPQPADSTKPDYGDGYKLDNPQRMGNCATCHTPIASNISNEKNCGWSGCHTNLTSERSTKVMDPGVNPAHLTGMAADGISCDFCHKISAVKLDPKTGLPKADMPGILSMTLNRPAEGQQIFFGTFGDVTRRVAPLPLLSQSEYCAPCHYGIFGGVVGDGTVANGTLIYNSYGEWLASPYSDPKTGQTCQNCHMRTLDTGMSVFPEQGGIIRDYADMHEHYMPGASDKALLQNSVTLDATAEHLGSQLTVNVNVTNDRVGHSIPTDAPTREMILIVQATDANGKSLMLTTGPILPQWSGNYANLPGRDFAKILQDGWTGEYPTAAYWRPVTIFKDTRLAALATDTSSYTFYLPGERTAQVSVQLIFRRSFAALAQEKGWNDPDILMEQTTIQVEK